MILRTSNFHDFQDPMLARGLLQGFRPSASNGVDTIGKNAKNYWGPCQNDSFDGLEPEISLVKGGPGPQTGGIGMGNLAPPGDREESASHHIIIGIENDFLFI